MRKFIGIIVALGAIIAFSGCGGNSAGVASGATSTTGTPGGGGTGLGTLTEIGPKIFPEFIDDTGRIIAYESDSRSLFFYQGTTRTPLPTPPDGVSLRVADMNFAGQIACYSIDSSDKPVSAYLLVGSTFTKLTNPSSKFTYPIQIAENGKILGSDYTIPKSGSATCQIWDTLGTPTAVSIPRTLIPTALNSGGDVLGYTSYYETPDPGTTKDTWCKISGGTVTDLGVQVGHSFLRSIFNSRISDSGIIVVTKSSESVMILPGGGRKTIPFAINSRITSNGSFCGTDPVTQIVSPKLWIEAGIVYYAPLGFARSVKSIVDPTGASLCSGASVINNSFFTAGIYHRSEAESDTARMYTLQVTAENFGGVSPVIEMPDTVTILARGKSKFDPIVRYASDPSLTFSVVEADGGTIDADGTYRAPAKAGTYHVVAKLVSNPSITDTSAVTVTGLGGDSGPVYSEPAPVQGPSAGFKVFRMKSDGAMVGFSSDTNPEALYWSSPSATPVTLNRTGYVSAKATDVRGGIIVGLVTDSSFSFPAYWATPTSAPVKLSIPSGVTFYPTDSVSINASGQIVYGNLYWSAKDATATPYAEPTAISSSSVKPLILDDSSIVIVNASPTRYFASPTSGSVSLADGTSFVSYIYGAAEDGSEVYGVSGSFAPGEPAKWSKSTGMGRTALTVPSSISQIFASTKTADGVWGSVSYGDGTTGAGLVSSGGFKDLRAMITNAENWNISGLIGHSNGGTAVFVGSSSSSTTNRYYYSSKL